LLTGYLGGAVATHVRIGDGLFPIFFPVILGVRYGEGFSCAMTGWAPCFHGEVRRDAALNVLPGARRSLNYDH
jgi:hypothetical protein